MSKFHILNDCNFGAPYLHPPKSIFDKNVDIDSNSNIIFCDKKFNSIQDVMKIWHAFLCNGGGSSFGL